MKLIPLIALLLLSGCANACDMCAYHCPVFKAEAWR